MAPGRVVSHCSPCKLGKEHCGLLLYLVSNRVFHLEILFALRKTLMTPHCICPTSTTPSWQKLWQGGMVTCLLFSSHIYVFFESRGVVESLRVCFRDGLAMSLLCGFLGFIDNSYPAQVRTTLEGNLFYLKVCVPNYLINAKLALI